MIGVIHHISDNELRESLKEIKRILAPGGVFISHDPCFTKRMNPIANIICRLDRGKYVRDANRYISLQKEAWKDVNYEMYIQVIGIIQ